MYLQALAYTQGVPIDMHRLSELGRDDSTKAKELQTKIDEFLVARQWEGTVLPVHAEITAPAIKEVVLLLGVELKTAVRTLSKLVPLIAALEHPGAQILASIVEQNDLSAFNKFIADRWTAKPVLNTGSPLQLQKLLYDTLKVPVRLRNKATDTMRAKGIREGNARTDEDAMMMAIKLGDVEGQEADVLRALVEAKSIRTRQGLYWEAYPKFLHHVTGRIHPSLRQSSTNTRRYTGAEPNLQQMDSNPQGVRSVILPHHRNAIIASLDESAQEVRQMADYCKDENLLTCYVGTADQLRDVHSIVASRIAGCGYQEFRRRLKKGSDDEMKVANDQRQKAKVTLFATLYGAAAPKIAEGLGIPEIEAQEYIEAIYEQFPGAKRWKEETENLATDQGWVPIHGGSKRHLQSLVMSDDRYTASKALRQAGNARIQAAGGNQLKRIMGRIWDSDLLDNYDYRWYFSVHDETVHSIGRKDAAAVLEKLHGFMCEQFLDVVPSASSIGVGRNFGQLQELGESFDRETLQDTVQALFF
jgi:DNA polymerase-1